MSKGALNVDKAIWELYEKIPHLLCEQPFKLSPGEDIDSIASWLYDILSECTNEISDIEVEHI